MSKFADFLDPIQDLLEPSPERREPGSQQDRRLWHYLTMKPVAVPKVALLGFPVDEGVRRNGGRFGAAGAPERIRDFLFRLTPDAREMELSDAILESAFDFGDVRVAASLEDSQKNLSIVVSHLLENNVFPIIIGGGHETAFGHFRGYRKQGKQPWILNVDAHPDVRELIDGRGHSGSPFRQAADAVPPVSSYVVAGLQPMSVVESHLRFMRDRGFRFIFCDEMLPGMVSDLLSAANDNVMVTLDMDVVDQAFAPGVSAPAVGGLSSRQLLDIGFDCGRASSVRSIDIVEVNPAVDLGDRTSRLAAATIWQVLRGLSHREK